tara:strand:+ start:1434 stop:2555 length:1122 start_codon:yes stop_codon:yes gene_type:complete
VFITHTLSEINVLYPLFAALSKEGKFEITVIFTVKKIYKQYMNGNFYNYCENVLGIKTEICHLPNKFDKDLNKLNLLPFWYLIKRFVFLLWSYIKLPKLIKKLISNDIFMHEFSDRREVTKFFYLIQIFMKKKIFTYHHGNEISIDKTAYPPKINTGDRIILIFHRHNSTYMEKMGYPHQAIIGYPIFFPEWKKIVNEYPGGEISQGSIVLINSRHVVEQYMDKDKYFYLLESALRVLRKNFVDIPIVIKPHPREDLDVINEIIYQQKISNVLISFEHPAVLAKTAVMATTFWGSVILESLSMGIPTVEYYIEAERFRDDYPNGSNYKAVGIHTASNEKELENFAESVINNTYKFPEIVNEFKEGKDLSIFYS